MHFFVKYFLMFLFFSSAGWLIESLYCSLGPVIRKKVDHFKFINRGFLTGPMTPIYGVSCMAMLATLLPFRNNLFALFFMGMLVCDVVEYATSVIMEKLFNARWWDYTGYFLNLKGRICFRNSIIWGALSVLFLKLIYPGVNRLFDWLLGAVTWEGIIAITFLLLGIFLVDLGRTVVASLNISKLIHRAQRFREEFGPRKDELLEDLQHTYVDEVRSSVNHMTGWQRYRIKRLVNTYPQLTQYVLETREEVLKNRDFSTLVKEFQFLKMDMEAFFTHEKNEMY